MKIPRPVKAGGIFFIGLCIGLGHSTTKIEHKHVHAGGSVKGEAAPPQIIYRDRVVTSPVPAPPRVRIVEKKVLVPVRPKPAPTVTIQATLPEVCGTMVTRLSDVRNNQDPISEDSSQVLDIIDAAVRDIAGRDDQALNRHIERLRAVKAHLSDAQLEVLTSIDRFGQSLEACRKELSEK